MATHTNGEEYETMMSVARGTVARGYDKEFKQPPPEDLLCSSCRLVARQPHQSRCDCQKLYCKTCLDALEASSKDCLKCLKPLNSFPNELRALKIKVLPVQCDMSSNGCKWTGPLWQLESHLSSCIFSTIPCTNNCGHQTLRKNLSQHLKDCPLRPHTCPHCQEEGEYGDITEQHLQTCPKIEVLCSNGGCGKKMKRQALQAHLRECRYRRMHCPFKSIGCMHGVSLGDFDKHATEHATEHLTLAVDVLKEQQKKIMSLEHDLLSQLQDNLERHHSQVDRKIQALEESSRDPTSSSNTLLQDVESHVQRQPIRVPSFTEAKLGNRVWYSKPFYMNGYKMCLGVHPNGHDTARDSYVSLFLHAMRGLHDEDLQWPFQGEITLQLLNQLADKRHVTKTLQYTNPKILAKNVEKGVGQGFTSFIAHHLLDHNPSWNTQYLMDDCIFVRVSVKVRTARPWLTSAK